MRIDLKIIAFILLFCMLLSCNKEEQAPGDTVSKFKIQFIDSFSFRRVPEIKVQLLRTVYHLPFGPTDYYFLDTFTSDSNGQILFELNKEQSENVFEYSLIGIKTPEIYLSVATIPGIHFQSYNQGRSYNVVPAAFVKIREFDILKNDNQKCDYYHLNHYNGSVVNSLISWSYGNSIGTEYRYAKLHYQGNDSFTARYGCAAYRGYKTVKINLVPFDTIILSDYFPK